LTPCRRRHGSTFVIRFESRLGSAPIFPHPHAGCDPPGPTPPSPCSTGARPRGGRRGNYSLRSDAGSSRRAMLLATSAFTTWIFPPVAPHRGHAPAPDRDLAVYMRSPPPSTGCQTPAAWAASHAGATSVRGRWQYLQSGTWSRVSIGGCVSDQPARALDGSGAAGRVPMRSGTTGTTGTADDRGTRARSPPRLHPGRMGLVPSRSLRLVYS
jgi:hypothetical protein